MNKAISPTITPFIIGIEYGFVNLIPQKVTILILLTGHSDFYLNNRWSKLVVRKFIKERMKKMGRHGENIRKRADGRWEARYIQYHNVDGKAVYRYTYGKTYLEVKQKRKLAMEETSVVPRGAEAASKITFYKLTEEWLKIKKGQVKQSTYSNYVNLIQKQLLPELGNLYVSSLTTPYLEQFLQKKLACGRLDGKGGLSNKTVCDLRSILKLILQYAKKIGYFCPSDLKFSIPAGHPPKIEVLEKSDLVNI